MEHGASACKDGLLVELNAPIETGRKVGVESIADARACTEEKVRLRFAGNCLMIGAPARIDLLPILSLPIYWPYHGQLCDSAEDCESFYFETFSWNNDVK